MGIFGGIAADKYDRTYSDGYLLKRLWQYMKPYRRQFTIILGLVLVFSMIGALIPFTISLIKNLINL